MNQFLTLFVTFTAICLTLGTVQATPITTLFQGLQTGLSSTSPALGSPDLSALGSPSLVPEQLTQLLSTLFPALNSLSPAPAANTQPDISIEVQR